MMKECTAPSVSTQLTTLRIIQAAGLLTAAISLFLQIPLYIEQAEIVQRLQQDVRDFKKKCTDGPDDMLY